MANAGCKPKCFLTRDLAHQQASLKDYFADEQVQAYLEALPTQEATNELTVVPQSLTHA